MENTFTGRQRVLLCLACSAIFFEAFDVSIVNLALPVMAHDLRIPLAATQWIQTLYLLSFGGFLLLGGRLCDYAGSKRIFIAGMTLFGVASLLAAVSAHLLLLLAARAGQGIGAALAMPGGISLLTKHFSEGQQRQTAIGIFGAFAAIGFAGGLALGGMIASLFDWHWIFGLNIPVIGGVLILGYFYIPAEALAKDKPVDLLTASWLTATLLLLCFGIHESSRLGWWVIPILLVAFISAIGLWRYDRRREQPFFDADIFPSAGAAYRSLGASMLLGGTFLPFVFICTLALSQGMGWGIRETGFLLFPYSIGSALVSKYLLPWLFKRRSPVQVGLLCMQSLLAGTLLLAAGIYTGGILWFAVAFLLVNSLSIAIGYPAFTILSLAGVAPARQGIAAGIQSAIYSVGTGVGLSVIGLCLQLSAGYTMVTQLVIGCIVISICCMIAIALLLTSKRS